jgi:N-methylhydantoinase A/oxoprolinase/acetone carboxylase beta subunit
VILDLAPGAAKPVVASHKSHTTPDVTDGIQNAVEAALSKANVERARIQAVAIGTTSFVNSLVERDARVLQRVAAIRLCGPHSRLAPPFVSFPYELRAILEGPVFFAAGGLQVDGREIESVSMSTELGAH